MAADDGAFAHLAGLRILLADDEGMITDVLQKGLSSRLRCTPEVVDTGDQALSRIEAGDIGLFITDMRMPGTQGFALVSEVRRRFPSLPVIVMTGYRNEFPYLEAIRAGANDFICKPFPIEELEAKIHRVLIEAKALLERERSERKYRNLFQHSADGMVMIDYDTFEIEDANAAFREMLKSTMTDLRGKPVFEFCDSADAVRLGHWLGMVKHIGKGRMNGIEFKRPDGTRAFLDLSVSVTRAEEDYILLISFTDVTDKLQVEQQLADAAQRDELTGLYNKRTFNNRLEGAVAAARRGGEIALFMIDLDNFKRCNDTHGHQIGDKLLKQVGGAIHASIRAQQRDEGFRNGGDEFAVLVYEADLEACTHIAERIQAEFAAQECYGTTMSIGVCPFREGMTSDALVKAADEALYKAKRLGKNAIAIAD